MNLVHHGAGVPYISYDKKVDQGPILLQAIVPVYATDDPESLAMRVLQQEHLIYPLALKIITNQDLVLKLVTDKERLHQAQMKAKL